MIDDPVQFALLSRVLERLLISALIIGISISLMVVYRRKIQEIDVQMALDSKSFQTSASFAMPVFLLLVIVLYSWLSLTNPISLEATSTQERSADKPVGENQVDKSAPVVDTKHFVMNGFQPGSSEWQQTIEALQAIRVANVSMRELAANREESGEEIMEVGVVIHKSVNALDAFFFKSLSDKFSAELVEKCIPPLNSPAKANDDPACSDFNDILFTGR